MSTDYEWNLLFGELKFSYEYRTHGFQFVLLDVDVDRWILWYLSGSRSNYLGIFVFRQDRKGNSFMLGYSLIIFLLFLFDNLEVILIFEIQRDLSSLFIVIFVTTIHLYKVLIFLITILSHHLFLSRIIRILFIALWTLSSFTLMLTHCLFD